MLNSHSLKSPHLYQNPVSKSFSDEPFTPWGPASATAFEKTFDLQEGEGSISYKEYHGEGYPPHDLGFPGDIYVDTASVKRLFAKTALQGWQEWTGISGTGLYVTIAHPRDSTRVLFCGPADVSWRKSSGIATSIRRVWKSWPNPSEYVLSAHALLEIYLGSRKEGDTSSTKRKRTTTIDKPPRSKQAKGLRPEQRATAFMALNSQLAQTQPATLNAYSGASTGHIDADYTPTDNSHLIIKRDLILDSGLKLSAHDFYPRLDPHVVAATRAHTDEATSTWEDNVWENEHLQHEIVVSPPLGPSLVRETGVATNVVEVAKERSLKPLSQEAVIGASGRQHTSLSGIDQISLYPGSEDGPSTASMATEQCLNRADPKPKSSPGRDWIQLLAKSEEYFMMPVPHDFRGSSTETYCNKLGQPPSGSRTVETNACTGQEAAHRAKDLILGRTGVEFPKDTPIIQWSTGLRTTLPFVSGHEDQDAVKAMASGSDAVHSPEAPIVVLRYVQKSQGRGDEISSARNEFLKKIRETLAAGKMVLIRGWKPDNPVQFNSDGILSWRGSLSQPVEWQDAEMRAKAGRDGAFNIHQQTTLGDFIDAADNPSICGNCLDLPSLRDVCPDFVRDLDDSALAWEMTRDFYSQPRKRQEGLAGPQTIRFDNWRCQAWDLITHAGFLTRTHHDANGLCTYIYPQCGVKIWGGRQLNDSQGLSRLELLDLHSNFVMEGAEYLNVSTVFNIFLECGDFLIQPPGFWHEVYTPIKSITSGGHFYLYDALPLTEFSRAFDHKYALSSTNADHESAERTLTRMALALPYVLPARQISRRSLIALSTMIKSPKKYRPQQSSSSSGLKLRKTDLLFEEELREHSVALKIIDIITGILGIEKDADSLLAELEKSEDCGFDSLSMDLMNAFAARFKNWSFESI